MTGKLTGPQLMLLMDLADFQGLEGMYVEESYRPALKLVILGYAERKGRNDEYLAIAPAGRTALSRSSQAGEK